MQARILVPGVNASNATLFWCEEKDLSFTELLAFALESKSGGLPDYKKFYSWVKVMLETEGEQPTLEVIELNNQGIRRAWRDLQPWLMNVYLTFPQLDLGYVESVDIVPTGILVNVYMGRLPF